MEGLYNMEPVYKQLHELLVSVKFAGSFQSQSTDLELMKKIISVNARVLNYDRLLGLGFCNILYDVLVKEKDPRAVAAILHIMCNLSVGSIFTRSFRRPDFIDTLLSFLPKDVFKPEKDDVGHAIDSCWVLTNIIKDDQHVITYLFDNGIAQRLHLLWLSLLHQGAPFKIPPFETFFDFTANLTNMRKNRAIARSISPRSLKLIMEFSCEALAKLEKPEVVPDVAFTIGNILVTEDYPSSSSQLTQRIIQWTLEMCKVGSLVGKRAALHVLRGLSSLDDEIAENLLSRGLYDILQSLWGGLDPQLCEDVLFIVSNLCVTQSSERIERFIQLDCISDLLHPEFSSTVSNKVRLEALHVFIKLFTHATPIQLTDLVQRNIMQAATDLLLALGVRQYVIDFIQG